MYINILHGFSSNIILSIDRFTNEEIKKKEKKTKTNWIKKRIFVFLFINKNIASTR